MRHNRERRLHIRRTPLRIAHRPVAAPVLHRAPTPTGLACVICEEDPRCPSLLVPDPETRRHLRGDLDNVVLRAMAREPGRYARASASDFHRRTIALDEAMLREDPESTSLRRNLADELIALGYLRSFTGEHLADSLGDCRRAEGIMTSLSAADPANAEARQD